MLDPEDPDLRLALAYAPVTARPALATLFALDRRLGGIVARATEPAIGLMRLVWWRDALAALDDATAPAEPLLQACADLPGIGGAALAAMTAGWESLLDDPAIDEETIATHGRERGARLFALAARVLVGTEPPLEPIAAAGAGWALGDLARHLTQADRVAAAREQARPLLDEALGLRWPRELRPLGHLAAVAQFDLGGKAGPRWRVLRILRHQITGR